jgi:hypothetical protein
MNLRNLSEFFLYELSGQSYSTTKEIVKSRTLRCLVRTVVFEIRSLLVSLKWTYQSCVEWSARRGTTRRKYNRNSKRYC